ncbi:MAG: hypothetical protein WC365_02290 [Candidatus Babeliales bacterium]|jgi:hypothetical protein
MLNTKRILAAVILLCASALNAQVAQQSSDVEQAKWTTLRTVFTTKLAASKTFMNKLGSGMKNHARLLAFITEVGGALRVSVAILQNAKETISDMDSEDYDSQHPRNSVIDRLRLVVGIAAVFLLTEVIHCVYKKTGSWLEKESVRCKKLLTDVAMHWQEYQPMMPVVLHPLFEKLAGDIKIHGKLTVINDAEAGKLVESLMTMSLVLGTKK